jgi:hypothetical protein
MCTVGHTCHISAFSQAPCGCASPLVIAPPSLSPLVATQLHRALAARGPSVAMRMEARHRPIRSICAHPIVKQGSTTLRFASGLAGRLSSRTKNALRLVRSFRRQAASRSGLQVDQASTFASSMQLGVQVPGAASVSPSADLYRSARQRTAANPAAKSASIPATWSAPGAPIAATRSPVVSAPTGVDPAKTVV